MGSVIPGRNRSAAGHCESDTESHYNPDEDLEESYDSGDDQLDSDYDPESDVQSYVSYCPSSDDEQSADVGKPALPVGDGGFPAPEVSSTSSRTKWDLFRQVTIPGQGSIIGNMCRIIEDAMFETMPIDGPKLVEPQDMQQTIKSFVEQRVLKKLSFSCQ